MLRRRSPAIFTVDIDDIDNPPALNRFDEAGDARGGGNCAVSFVSAAHDFSVSRIFFERYAPSEMVPPTAIAPRPRNQRDSPSGTISTRSVNAARACRVAVGTDSSANDAR